MYNDILFELASNEIEEYKKDLFTCSENNLEVVFESSYKTAIYKELLSILADDFDEEQARILVSKSNGYPLAFLYDEWITSNIVPSIRDDLLSIIYDIVSVKV